MIAVHDYSSVDGRYSYLQWLLLRVLSDHALKLVFKATGGQKYENKVFLLLFELHWWQSDAGSRAWSSHPGDGAVTLSSQDKKL